MTRRPAHADGLSSQARAALLVGCGWKASQTHRETGIQGKARSWHKHRVQIAVSPALRSYSASPSRSAPSPAPEPQSRAAVGTLAIKGAGAGAKVQKRRVTGPYVRVTGSYVLAGTKSAPRPSGASGRINRRAAGLHSFTNKPPASTHPQALQHKPHPRSDSLLRPSDQPSSVQWPPSPPQSVLSHR